MKPHRATVTTRLLLGLMVGTLLSGAGFAQSAASPNAAPSPWDQQSNAAATQAEASFAKYKFRDGETLDPVKIHYATLGKPHRNTRGDINNAVLVLHWTGADSRVLLSPTFTNALFGPGRPLDASRYYLIFPDSVGHGQSSKPSDGLKASFPNYDYGDIVDLQHRLVTETLGIKHLHAILGISMGGMNAWQWAEAYPEMMDGVMPVVSLPIPVSGRNLLWRRMVIDAIRSDPDWKDGDYIKAPPGWIVGYTILRMMIDSVSALQHEVPNGQAADILGDAGLADLDTELEKLSMDYRRSPQRVGDAHLADQPANFQRHSWSAAAVSRFPAAIRSETGTVPTDDGVRLHNRQRLDGIWHQTIQPNKDQAIHGTEGHSLRHRPAMDVKLMTKDQDLRFQRDP